MRLAWVVGISLGVCSGAMARGRYVPMRTAMQGMVASGEIRCTDSPHGATHLTSHPCDFVFVDASTGDEWNVRNADLFRELHQKNAAPIRGSIRGAHSPRYLFGNGYVVVNEFEHTPELN